MHPTMFSYTSMLKKLFEKQEEVVQIKDFWKVLLNSSSTNLPIKFRNIFSSILIFPVYKIVHGE